MPIVELPVGHERRHIFHDPAAHPGVTSTPSARAAGRAAAQRDHERASTALDLLGRTEERGPASPTCEHPTGRAHIGRAARESTFL
jgi:hypothetical protein